MLKLYRASSSSTFAKLARAASSLGASIASGAHFEEKSEEFLIRLGLDNVRRCGQSWDKGIDLRATWRLRRKDFEMIVQCKKLYRRVSAAAFRELQGALANERTGTIAMMLSSSDLSIDAYQWFLRAPMPLMFVSCCWDNDILPDDNLFGDLQSYYLNEACRTTMPDLVVGQRRDRYRRKHIELFELMIDGRFEKLYPVPWWELRQRKLERATGSRS